MPKSQKAKKQDIPPLVPPRSGGKKKREPTALHAQGFKPFPRKPSKPAKQADDFELGTYSQAGKDVALRGFYTRSEKLTRIFAGFAKTGATNAQIKQAILDCRFGAAGGHSGPGLVPITYSEHGLVIWFADGRGERRAALSSLPLMLEIRRVFKIPSSTDSGRVAKTDPARRTRSDSGKVAKIDPARRENLKRPLNPSFMTPVQPDTALAAVVGDKPQPRVRITQKLWEYIKAEGLQDAVNKRQINCDEKLKAVFGKNSVTMFEMNRLLLKHIGEASDSGRMAKIDPARRKQPAAERAQQHAQRAHRHAPLQVEEWRALLAGCTVLEGDCRQLINRIPDGSIDLVILDPPYGKDYQSHRTLIRKGKIIGDQTEYEALCLVEEIAPKLFRVLKADAHCYCFCDSEQDVNWIEPFTKAGFKMAGRLIWLRGRTMGDRTGQSYVSAYETVWFFTKGNRKLNGHRSNVIQIPKSSRELHPTQKNVYGLSELMEASSKPGDVVLDPFAGSGSTGAACRMMPDEARKVILMEIDPEHAKVCRERMRIYGKVEEKLET